MVTARDVPAFSSWLRSVAWSSPNPDPSSPTPYHPFQNRNSSFWPEANSSANYWNQIPNGTFDFPLTGASGIQIFVVKISRDIQDIQYTVTLDACKASVQTNQRICQNIYDKHEKRQPLYYQTLPAAQQQPNAPLILVVDCCAAVRHTAFRHHFWLLDRNSVPSPV